MTDSRVIRNQKGFTLIELLMVAFMLGLVLVSLYSLYVSSQRTAIVQEDVADVQQNLRVAMDSLTKDVRHAGFLITQFYDSTLVGSGPVSPVTNGNVGGVQTVNTVLSNAANSPTLPVTRDVITGATGTHADLLTLNVPSSAADFARLNANQTWAPGAAFTFTVSTPESVDLFKVDAVNPDYVRIISPVSHRQPTSPDATTGLPDTGTVYRVTATNRLAQTIQLTWDSGNLPDGKEFKRNDVMFKIASDNRNLYPATVTYCLGNGATVGCAPIGLNPNQCPRRTTTDQTMCLIRIDNGTPQVLASGISGLQFTYLLDNGNEVPNAITALPLTDLTTIRAIRVTITGQTARAGIMQGATEHVRSMTSVIKLQNRYMLQ